jgi:uncharacterized protein (DUF1697 family)
MSYKYVVLLRGINVGGNGIIKMAELVKTFEGMGFSKVKSYIQSGNVLFESSEKSARRLETMIEEEILKKHKVNTKAVVLSASQIEKIVKSIPKDWTKPELNKYNVIFLRHEVDSKDVLKELKPKEEIEAVVYVPGVLFWSAATSTLTRSSMVKLAAQPLYKHVTIRNLNTTKKIWEMMREG